MTSHTNNAYIFSQFCMENKIVTQLPVAVVRPYSILHLDELTLALEARLSSYKEDQRSHCINSLRNLYLNLILNNNITLLNLNTKLSFEALKIETILKSLEQRDLQLTNDFERCIKEVQKYLSGNQFEFDKKNKAEILTKIINTEVVGLKAIDQEPTLNNYIKYDYIKR